MNYQSKMDMREVLPSNVPEREGDRRFRHAPTLTVVLVTYNHERYIRQALDGLVMQRVPFDIEIVVADDGSTDETREIIREYMQRVSGFNVRFLDWSQNLGVTRNYRRAFLACSTEYVAVLEGDDYWVNPDKLAIQLEYLDKHRECVACANNYFVYYEDKLQFTARAAINEDSSYADARSLIHDNLIGNFSTCMYRSAALRTIPPQVFETRSYDWIVNICLSRYGLIGFLHQAMSVYRVHGNGAWSMMTDVERVAAQLSQISEYDRLTDRAFAPEFEQFLRETPPGQRKGRVFRPIDKTGSDRQLTAHHVGVVIGDVGQRSGVKVNVLKEATDATPEEGEACHRTRSAAGLRNPLGAARHAHRFAAAHAA